MPAHRSPRRACLLAAAITLTLTGCPRVYDFERQQVERGTLGEELHTIWLKDARRAATKGEQKATMLERDREVFVTAVDTIAPPDQLREVDGFLQNTLSLVDGGELPQLTRKLYTTLDEASGDAELMRAFGDLSRPQPEDFMSPVAEPNLIGYLTAYPKLGDLSKRTTRILLDNDGFADDGSYLATEPTGATDLTRTLVHTLKTVEPQVLEDNLPLLIRDMLLRPDARFAPADATRPLYVAVYDQRGYPRVKRDAAGAVLAPFRDSNGDGLADLDERGQFIIANADPLTLKPFDRSSSPTPLFTRDAFGRAKTAEGSFAFDYIDLNETGLGYLVREYAGLAEADVVSDLLLVLRRVMGTMVPQADGQGTYQGFSNDHPIVELIRALVHILAYDDLPELMRESGRFFNEGSDAIAGLLVALDKLAEIADRHPEAALTDEQTLAYDLIPTLHELTADPALFKDVMDALGDPMTRRVGDAMLTLMAYKNTKAEVELGGRYDACFQQCKASFTQGTEPRFECIRACPNDEIFKEPFDPKAPESPTNRSMFQAVWHLMWGLAGVPYAMDLEEIKIAGRTLPPLPPMVALDGGAEAFVRAIAGNMDMAEHVPPELFTSDLGPLLNLFGVDGANIAGVISILSQLFGVQLDRKPTHDQLTRMFAKPELIFGEPGGDTVIDIAEPRDKDGYKLGQGGLADGLFEAEAAGLIDAVTPVSRAFSKHNREDLMLALFSTVHLHYPGDASLYRRIDGTPSTDKSANLRSYEPILKEAFEEGTLLEALVHLSTRVKAIEDSRGIQLNEQLRRIIHHATRPERFMTSAGDTFITLGDGRTETDLSRAHVMFKAIEDLADRVKDDPEAEAVLSRSVDNVLNLALKSEWPAGERPRFVKQGGVALTVTLSDFLAERAAEKRDNGELNTWLIESVFPTLRDFWSSRLLAGLVTIGERVLKDEANKAALGEAIAYMVGTPRGREHTSLIGYEIAVRAIDVKTWVPLARTLGGALDPEREWATGGRFAKLPMLSHGALVLDRTLELDAEEAGLRLIQRAVTRQGNAPMPIASLMDVVGNYWRVEPDAEAPFSAEDYRTFLTSLSGWLADDRHGLEQAFDLVKQRK